ncbi:hypothetical protein V1506DRAFT_533316 [Lipomyces tetrasporus]
MVFLSIWFVASRLCFLPHAICAPLYTAHNNKSAVETNRQTSSSIFLVQREIRRQSESQTRSSSQLLMKWTVTHRSD